MGEAVYTPLQDRWLGSALRYRLGRPEELMQVPEEVRKCVAYVGYNANDGPRLGGTAFLVSVPMKEVPDKKWIHIVTARHVIEKMGQRCTDNQVWLRFNLKKEEEGAAIVEVPMDSWYFHESDESVDVAVLDWVPPTELIDCRSIPQDMFATDKAIGKEFGIGDEVFITGLFGHHHGRRRNIPIIRIGNIAAMPEEKIAASCHWPEQEAYLIEARSLGGISGSPVFVHTLPYPSRRENKIVFGYMMYLLGLIHGHWDTRSPEGDLLGDDFDRVSSVNMGIALVVPASKILEVIMRSDREKQRKERIKKLLTEKGPTPDTLEDHAEILTKEDLEKVPPRVGKPRVDEGSDPALSDVLLLG